MNFGWNIEKKLHEKNVHKKNSMLFLETKIHEIPTPVFMKILKTFSPIKDKIKFIKFIPEIPG